MEANQAEFNDPQSQAVISKNHDNLVIPAGGKTAIDFNTVDEELNSGGIGGSAKPKVDEGGLKYTDIPSTLKLYADALLPWYGEECCVRLFNRKWQFREEGASMLVE